MHAIDGILKDDLVFTTLWIFYKPSFELSSSIL